MTSAVKVLVLCCLFEGSWCQRWAVLLPQSVESLSGSCVVVPCSFTLPSQWEQHLDDSCRAVWKRGSWSRTKVFDSGASLTSNVVQGNLTGDLKEKDCTTVFNNLPPNHYEHYYFRLECDNPLKFLFHTSVPIKIQDSLSGPTLTPSKLEVEEGAAVILNCTAVAPCPSQPPVLEWSPSMGQIEESLDVQSLTSVMNFTASHLHDGQKISCSALYSRPAANSELLYEMNVALNVLYSPKNPTVSYSSPVLEGSPVTLSCSASANPAVDSFTWFRMDGDHVMAVGSQQDFSTVVSEVDRHFFCQVQNKYGSQNSSVTQIDVQFPPKSTTVMVDPPGAVVEGSSVSLFCSTHSNPPVTNYSWYKGEEEDRDSGLVLVIESADVSHSGAYHCEARNELGEDKSATIHLDVQYPPKNTSVFSDPSGPVQEGGSVTLTCSSNANPAAVNFTWYRLSGPVRATVGYGKEYAFNVTKLSDDHFYCEALNVHGVDDSQPVRMDVTFAPEIVASSRCVKILSQIRCTCDSQGNPAPSLLWELAGETVNHSAMTPIREWPLSGVCTRSIITLHALDEDMPSLVCHSVNLLGSDSLVYNVSSIETQFGLHTLSLLIGSAAGALGMFVLCFPLLLFFCRKKNNSVLLYEKVRKTSDTVAINEVNSSKVIVNHANGALMDIQNGEEEDPILHTNKDAAELESKATEQEDIHQDSSGLNGDVEEGGEMGPDRHFEKIKDMDGLREQVGDKAPV